MKEQNQDIHEFQVGCYTVVGIIVVVVIISMLIF